MSALFGRAEARDFLDIDAAIQSGRYSKERLLKSRVRRGPRLQRRGVRRGARRTVTNH
jgi:hypothetical protein